MNEDAVGSIDLGSSSRLVFTLSWWKGRQYAHVRKFVETSRYTGPTKSGLAMAGEIILSLVETLNRLKAEVPGAEQKTFAKIGKNDSTEIVIAMIPPDDLKSLPSVDIREYVETSGYQGPTKKGVRFGWDKLPEFITILQALACKFGKAEGGQPTLFPEAKPGWVKDAEALGQDSKPARDSVVAELLPDGPKGFPGAFAHTKAAVGLVELPVEPVSVTQLPTGEYVVRSDFGFQYPVRNPSEGNFILYAYMRGHRKIEVPKEMIEIFKAVKAYENYLRDLRHALLQAYERKSGHRPIAEHQTRELFNTLGLPWL